MKPRQTTLVFALSLFGGLPVATGAQPPGDVRDRDRDAPAQTRIVPPGERPGTEGPWSLGVRVTYSETGARINFVDPRSAAGRAGLETGDTIVSVDGYQIGYVRRRLYELGPELQLRADRSGRVRLLVQNRRNNELVNMDIALDRSRPPQPRPRPPGNRGRVTGTLTYRERVALPPEAVAVVRLVDASSPLSSLTPIAQDTLADIGQVPIRFTLRYDPQRIDPNRRYAIRAEILVNGLRRFHTRRDFNVITQGNPDEIEVLLELGR